MINLRNIALSIIFFACWLPAVAQNADFEKIAKLPNVSYAYISKPMLRTIESENQGDEEYFGFLNSTKNLNSVEIIRCEDPETIPEIRTLLDDVADGLELLSKLDLDNSNMDVFGKRKGDGLSKLLVISRTPDKLISVYITGKMDADTLKSIAEMNQKTTN